MHVARGGWGRLQNDLNIYKIGYHRVSVASGTKLSRCQRYGADFQNVFWIYKMCFRIYKIVFAPGPRATVTEMPAGAVAGGRQAGAAIGAARGKGCGHVGGT